MFYRVSITANPDRTPSAIAQFSVIKCFLIGQIPLGAHSLETMTLYENSQSYIRQS